MNAGNKITIKSVSIDDARLPSVIHGAIGNPSPEKVLEGIGSYKNSDHSIIGAAVGDPACDLVIAWTYLSGKARETFIYEMDMDPDTWLRARAFGYLRKSNI